MARVHRVAPRIAAIFERRHAAPAASAYPARCDRTGARASARFADAGSDLRGQRFEPFFAAQIVGASAVEVTGGHLDITVWKEGSAERVVRKH